MTSPIAIRKTADTMTNSKRNLFMIAPVSVFTLTGKVASTLHGGGSF
jgi:hypothetical protein